jgi:hypothetical protein
MTKDELESRVKALRSHLAASEDARKALLAELRVKTLECDLLSAMCDMVLQGLATMRMDGGRAVFTLKDDG